MREDREHLNILAICQYVMGALTFFGSCGGLFYIFLGLRIIDAAKQNDPEPPPEFIGWVLVWFGAGMTVLLWILAAMTLIAARKLQTYNGRIYCIVVAAIQLLQIPLGTVLGVFTMIVLLRPSVKDLFDGDEKWKFENGRISDDRDRDRDYRGRERDDRERGRDDRGYGRDDDRGRDKDDRYFSR